MTNGSSKSDVIEQDGRLLQASAGGRTFRNVKFVGTTEVQDRRGTQQVFAAFDRLTDKKHASYVDVSNYKAVSVTVSPTAGLIALDEDHKMVVNVKLSTISHCARGPSNTNQKYYFGVTATNSLPADMEHACHVFRAVSESLAETIVKSLGEAFQSLHELAPDERFRSKSMRSVASNVSGASNSSSRMTLESGSPVQPSGFPVDVTSGKSRHRRTSSDDVRASGILRSGLGRSRTFSQDPNKLAATASEIYRLSRDQSFLVTGEENNEVTTMFRGDCIIDWMLEQTTNLADVNIKTRKQASSLLSSLFMMDHIRSADGSTTSFKDSPSLYRFSADEPIHTGECAVDKKLIEAISVDDVEQIRLSVEGKEGDESLLGALLTHCTMHRSYKVADFLLEVGASLDSRCRNGETPLHIAASSNDRQMMELLLMNGADTEIRNNIGETPLQQACQSPANLECVIALLENGAHLNVHDQKKNNPLTYMPELKEIQMKLAEGAANLIPGQSVEAKLVALQKLSGNIETHSALLAVLREPAASEHFAETSTACSLSDRTAFVQILRDLMEPRERLVSACGQGGLSLLVALLRTSNDSVGVVALNYLFDLVSAPAPNEPDFLAKFAKQPISKLARMLHHESHQAVAHAAALLKIVTRYPAGHATLLNVEAMVGITESLIAHETDVDNDILLDLIQAACHVAHFENAHEFMIAAKMKGAMKILLKKPKVRRFACFFLAALGEPKLDCPTFIEPDVNTINSGLDDEHHLVLLENCDNLPLVAQIKNASMIKMIQIVVGNSAAGPVDVCWLVFLGYHEYMSSVVLLRLLVFLFRSRKMKRNSTTIDPLHERVLQLVQMWIRAVPEDFKENEIVLKTLEKWLGSVRAAGGAYCQMAEGLLSVVISGNPEKYKAKDSYDNAPHHKLFKDAVEVVLSGEEEISRDNHVFLAALHLHILNLEREQSNPSTSGRRRLSSSSPKRVKGVRSDPRDPDTPNFKLKYLMPHTLAKGSFADELKEEVIVKYHKVKILSDRDAKHKYLETFEQAAHHEFRDFRVKLVSDAKHPKWSILTIQPKQIILKDESTKEVIETFPFTHLRRWNSLFLKDRGKDRFKIVAQGKPKAHMHLMLSFRQKDLLLEADESAVSTICHSLASQIEYMKSVQEKRKRRAPSDTKQGATHEGSRDASEEDKPSFDEGRTRSLSDDIERDRSDSLLSIGEPAVAADPQSGLKEGEDGEGLQFTPETQRRAIRRQQSQKGLPMLPACRCPPNPRYGSLDISNITVPELFRHPKEVARQLTIIEFGLFSAIQCSDFLNKVVRPEKANTEQQDALIQHHNKMSQAFTSIIIAAANDHRSQIIVGLIHVAKECYALGNFNAVVEVMAALQATSVSRLADVWATIPAKAMDYFKRLQPVVEAADNFRELRRCLSKVKLPAIPYIGIFSRDVILTHVGNTNFGRTGLPNIHKWKMLLSHLKHLERFQSQGFNFLRVPAIAEFLDSLELLDDITIYEKSQEIQPRSSS